MAKKNLGLSKEPQILLVYKFVLFCSESRKNCAITVAPLGYDLENFKFWLKIVVHNRNLLRGYYSATGGTIGFSVKSTTPSDVASSGHTVSSRLP